MKKFLAAVVFMCSSGNVFGTLQDELDNQPQPIVLHTNGSLEIGAYASVLKKDTHTVYYSTNPNIKIHGQKTVLGPISLDRDNTELLKAFGNLRK